MAKATSKEHCVKCGKERATLKCAGCLRDFCYDHLNDHRQELSQQFDEIEFNRDLFRQTLNEQSNNSLFKQIDQWEKDSIEIIKQTANQCRQILIQHTNNNINQIEINLSKLTDQLKYTRQENNFNEIDLNQYKDKLKQLRIELNRLHNVSIQQDSTSLVNKISVLVSYGDFINSMNINNDTKWIQNGNIIVGGYGQGYQLNQLYYPKGIYIDDNDQIIYIADSENNRIVEWKWGDKNGRIVAGGNGQGLKIDQLKWPRDVIIDKINNSFIISDYGNERIMRYSRTNTTKGQIIISNINCSHLKMDENNGDIYISDCENHEVRRWKIGEINGTIVAGGNGKGNHLNQLNEPTYIFIDQNHSVYISDTWNHRVIKWIKNAKEGIIVAGGQNEGNSLTQLSYPQGILVDHLDNVYVADAGNHRIMRWLKGSCEGSIVVGRNGCGQQTNQFNYLEGLAFDQQGNIFVVDVYNSRVLKFDIDSN